MTVLENFKAISKIPHCSHQAQALKKYLVAQTKALGYEVEVDAIGNILCHKTKSNITLQSHYDMVCIGKAPQLELIEKEQWLYANDATLGADNGIGIAMTLSLMQEGYDVDALFTAEEEVGLLGARALELKIQTPFLLNIDSEDEGIVTIGCAGGVDILATLPISMAQEEVAVKECVAEGFAGGHSGVDIDKNIPNAIKELVQEFHKHDKLLAIKGGERRNSIAKYAKASVAQTGQQCGIKESAAVINESAQIISMLQGFNHGVRSFNEDLEIVHSSINLAMIESFEDRLEVHLSARAMSLQSLKALEDETIKYFESYGASVRSEGFYPPWKPEKSAFALTVLEASKKHFPKSTFGAIHAGLECGILKEKAPEVDMASIGPNIKYPHSNRECVDLVSVEKVYTLVKEIVEEECT